MIAGEKVPAFASESELQRLARMVRRIQGNNDTALAVFTTWIVPNFAPTAEINSRMLGARPTKAK
jgi:hypothetical protein